MSEPFDPYRKWLGIPPKDQPPNHYRLLGIAHFEDDPDVIENAATRQIAHVRTYQSGKHSAESQKLLNELTSAKLCLLQAERKTTYDDKLRAKLAAEGKLSSDNLLVTSEVMEEPPAYDDAPVEEFPEPKRNSLRWKTETEEAGSAEPPIVPIPMPPGSAVAAPPRLSPSLPHAPAPLMVSGPSRAAYRPKKSSSAAAPLIIGMVALVLVVGGGITAVVLSGALSAKPAEKQPKKAVVTPTNFPIGTGTKEKKETSSITRPTPKPSRPEREHRPETSSTETPRPEHPQKPFDRGAIEDEVRQALFLGRQALEKRDADNCKMHVVTAENLLVAHSEVDSKLQEQVQLLRELLTLNDEFWAIVRDAAINGKVPLGEKLKFRKEEFELVKHEGDQVTYKLGEKEETHPLLEMRAKAALALAFHSTKEDEAKRLNMLAFCMIDKRAHDERFDHNWAKNLYTRLALDGHTNGKLARELGVAEKPDPEKTKIPEDEDMPAKKSNPKSEIPNPKS
ncbi:MAG: hypothetical protein ACKVP0_28295 [Pirellulaceae bacterium]